MDSNHTSFKQYSISQAIDFLNANSPNPNVDVLNLNYLIKSKKLTPVINYNGVLEEVYKLTPEGYCALMGTPAFDNEIPEETVLEFSDYEGMIIPKDLNVLFQMINDKKPMHFLKFEIYNSAKKIIRYNGDACMRASLLSIPLYFRVKADNAHWRFDKDKGIELSSESVFFLEYELQKLKNELVNVIANSFDLPVTLDNKNCKIEESEKTERNDEVAIFMKKLLVHKPRISDRDLWLKIKEAAKEETFPFKDTKHSTTVKYESGPQSDDEYKDLTRATMIKRYKRYVRDMDNRADQADQADQAD